MVAGNLDDVRKCEVLLKTTIVELVEEMRKSVENLEALAKKTTSDGASLEEKVYFIIELKTVQVLAQTICELYHILLSHRMGGGEG